MLRTTLAPRVQWGDALLGIGIARNSVEASPVK